MLNRFKAMNILAAAILMSANFYFDLHTANDYFVQLHVGRASFLATRSVV